MPITIVQRPAHASNFRAGRSIGGRDVGAPRMIIIHTMQGTAPGTAAWFAQEHPAGAASSAHYGIGADGSVSQYVQETDTAFHSGNGEYNALSIGIELEGDCDKPGWCTAPMRAALVELGHAICDRYGIPASHVNIFGHADVPAARPGHKGELGGAGHHHDPGASFDFRGLVLALSGAQPGF